AMEVMIPRYRRSVLWREPLEIHWMLERFGVITDEEVISMCSEQSARVREVGVRLVERRLPKKQDFGEALIARAEDSDPHVRFRTALALGSWQDKRAVE